MFQSLSVTGPLTLPVPTSTTMDRPSRKLVGIPFILKRTVHSATRDPNSVLKSSVTATVVTVSHARSILLGMPSMRLMDPAKMLEPVVRTSVSLPFLRVQGLSLLSSLWAIRPRGDRSSNLRLNPRRSHPALLTTTHLSQAHLLRPAVRPLLLLPPTARVPAPAPALAPAALKQPRLLTIRLWSSTAQLLTMKRSQSSPTRLLMEAPPRWRPSPPRMHYLNQVSRWEPHRLFPCRYCRL